MDAVEKIFGFGGKFLEILTMKPLYKKVGHAIDYNQEQDLVLTEYVSVVKQGFLKKGKSA